MSGQKRQLAAIMFTDIVGYTALMGKDSAKALKLVRISKRIQKSLVEKHNGRWLKEMGDGVLAQFSSAIDSVNCSIEIQKSARAELDAKLRIGIHLGDITVEEEDVYGDGVNVASRLESIADPGGIYISESIEKAIRGQTDIQAKYLGEITLKNVDYGVRTYALQGVGLPIPDLKEDKNLSGRFFAELKRRGVFRSGATYIVLSLLLILLLPYAKSLIDLPMWLSTVLYAFLIAGFPIAMYLAWNYERSPDGFIKTSSLKSWQNPYKGNQRKPLTNTIIIAVMALIIVFMYSQSRYFNEPGDKSGILSESENIDKSIAVLPFVNMSDDPDQEYFSDGLSEELLNLLSKIPELKVIGRTSSFSFKGKNEDLREIGRELGVSYLMEGSVRKSGDKIRVTAQLINAADGSHLWSDIYDRELVEIFAIQDEIAVKVVDQLKISIPGLVESTPVTKNMEAYNLLLEANYIKRQPGSYEKRILLMEHAIELDSSDARLWAGLADAYTTWGGNHVVRRDRAESARQAAEKAIALDHSNATAHHVLGGILWAFYWDWENAEKELILAEELSPEFTGARAPFYQSFGRWEDAINAQKQRIEVDPVNPLNWRTLGNIYLNAGRPGEAIQPLKKALELNPNWDTPWIELGRAYFNLGQYAQALESLDHVQDRENSRLLSYLEGTYYAMGNISESDIYFQELLKNDGEVDNSIMIAGAYARRGKADQCFDWLQKAYERKHPGMCLLKGESVFEEIIDLGDPRYNEFLVKMNLPVD